MISIHENELYDLLFCSIRYAMGRQTYMPTIVQDLVRTYAPKLTPVQRERLFVEVRSEISWHENRGKTCGSEYDHRDWKALQKFLEEQCQEAQG